MTRIAISGASGLIGRALTSALRADGVSVIRIGRGADADVRWSASFDTIDRDALDGIDAIVHLAGAPIAERWTPERKRAILDSRVKSTALLARTVGSLARRPRVFVCASAIGIYGDRGDELLTETSAPGQGFLADVVRKWEAAAEPARSAGVRVVNMRNGIVLSRGGGALAKMLLPFQLGVGGVIASGRQWMSWIAIDDVVRAIRSMFVGSLTGPVNVVSPNPVTNAEFTRTMGAALHRPTLMRVPALALRVLYGEMAVETVLASQRVVPSQLVAAGFQFATPTLDGALREVLGARAV